MRTQPHTPLIADVLRLVAHQPEHDDNIGQNFFRIKLK